MRNNKKMRDRFLGNIFVFFVVLLFLGRCSSTQSKGETTSSVKLGEGATPKITKEIREGFEGAVNLFNKLKEGGLTPQECEEVVAAFKKISDEVKGGFAEAIYNAGVVYEECKMEEKAKEMFELAIKINNKFAPPYVKLALFEFKKPGHGRAESLLKQALEADRRSYEAYTNLAIIQRERGELVEAQTNLRRALAINSDYMPAFAQMALLYMDIAEKKPQLLDIALLVCQQAVSRDPNWAPIYLIWGLAYIRKGDIVEALNKFQKAIELNPGFYEANMDFGAITLSFRGYEDATKALKQAVEIEPKSYEALIGYGVALRGLERYKEAEQQYKKALELDPNRPDAYYNLAILYQDYLPRTVSGTSPEEIMNQQIELYKQAIQYYNQFLTKCEAQPASCRFKDIITYKEIDITEKARKRIDNCNQLIAGLKEAIQLQKEAEKMKQEMAKQKAEQAVQPEQGEKKSEGAKTGNDKVEEQKQKAPETK